jgi:uncharacterized protein YidB (DUF937 family)
LGRKWPPPAGFAERIGKAAGSDTIDALAQEIGMSRDQLLHRLRAELPQSVDKLTPQGRVPTPEQAAQSI